MLDTKKSFHSLFYFLGNVAKHLAALFFQLHQLLQRAGRQLFSTSAEFCRGSSASVRWGGLWQAEPPTVFMKGSEGQSPSSVFGGSGGLRRTLGTAPGDPWDSKGQNCLKKVSFLEPKMCQKSSQERTKNLSIFKTNFKRFPGAISVENDVQLGAKNGRKKRSETSPCTSHRKSQKKCKK